MCGGVATLPQVAVEGSEGLRSGEYLLMWLSCPVTGRITQSARRWLGSGRHYTHIPILLGEEASAKPNLINKCSSPVPQLSEMKMILCGSEQSDGDSTREEGEREGGVGWGGVWYGVVGAQKEREREKRRQT